MYIRTSLFVSFETHPIFNSDYVSWPCNYKHIQIIWIRHNQRLQILYIQQNDRKVGTKYIYIGTHIYVTEYVTEVI